MNGANDINGSDSLSDEAAAWVVRVQSETATEEDWLALEAWLALSPQRRAAFDEAEMLWLELGERAADLLTSSQPATSENIVSLNTRRGAGKALGAWRPWMAIAASIAAVMVAVWLFEPFGPTPQVYETTVGQSREIALADGSHVLLNSSSRLTARVDPHHRRVTLDSGEAVFDVAKDHAHPFVVGVGDQSVTVVGTEFDILRFGGRDVVTVNRGVVKVAAANGSDGLGVRLMPGDQLSHVEGETTSDLHRVSSEDVLAWRNGYVVYTDRTLAEIALDLRRFFTTPIQVQGAAASLTFSGALRIDNEDAAIRALQDFLPVTAIHTSTAIVIRPR